MKNVGLGLVAAVATAALTLWGCPNEGLICSEGLTACGNKTCEDLSSDRRNCGACGVACQTGQICQASKCICAPGATECGGSCVVTASDPRHCGSCGTACAQGEVCESGSCRTACSTGTTQCGQSCVKLNEDPFNCGACGTACGEGTSCHNGQCLPDVVAACFTNGQVRAISSELVQGPLKQLGNGPQALEQFYDVLLSIDGTDSRLYQARLADLTQFAGRENPLGQFANDVLVDGPYVYVINSGSATLAVFSTGQPTDAGMPGDGGLTADAGEQDAGQPDAGGQDAGEQDAGEPDAGMMVDGGDADAGAAMDGGSATVDAGFWAGPDPLDTPMPSFPNGVQLTLVKEISFGENTYPQVMTKVGSSLYVTLYGGTTAVTAAAGQKVAVVNVTDPLNPTYDPAEAIDLSGLDLLGDGGTSFARPQGITSRGDKLYVALNNLDEFYGVAGPAYLAVIPVATKTPSLVKLPEDTCLNAVWTMTSGDKVLVSCAGKSDFSMFPLVITTETGLAMVGANDEVLSSVELDCAGITDGGCASPSVGRFGVKGSSVFVGDQSAGRVFVVDMVGNQLQPRRTHATAEGPINACPVDQATGYSNVGDLLAVP